MPPSIRTRAAKTNQWKIYVIPSAVNAHSDIKIRLKHYVLYVNKIRTNITRVTFVM